MQLECSIAYRRSRFSTRLPGDRIYVPSHFWLLQTEPGVWRIGMTRFATRMLGDLVEFSFEFEPCATIALGQTLGRYEGFKAVSDLYSAADGEFLGANPALEKDSTLIDTDPYGEGWLYAVRGVPDPGHVDVKGYSQLLDLAIDKIQQKAGTEESA